MATKQRYYNGKLTYYDSQTHERILPVAPEVYYDSFIGAGNLVIPAAGSAESGIDWVKKIVGVAPPTVAGVGDAANGVIACTLTSDSQKQDAMLYHDDHRCFSLEKKLVFEARVNLAVLPTLNAELNFGLVGDWIDDINNATYSAFFTADGSGEIFCEVDDNATDSSATSGVTAVVDTWRTYRIDFTDLTRPRFFIDGVEVTPTTSMPYAATGANAVLQPFVQAYKVSGAGVGTIKCDFVRIWGER